MEEAFDAMQTFFDALDGGGIGDAQIARSAETLARHESHMRLLEQLARQIQGILGTVARCARAVGEVRGDVGKSIEGTPGLDAGEIRDGAQSVDDALAAARPTPHPHSTPF